MSENRVGFNTNCLGPITITECVEIAEALNVKVIEVGPSVQRDTQAFKDVQHNSSVTISALIYGRNFLTHDVERRRDYRDNLREVIDIAIAADIKQITTSTGVDESLTLAENIDNALEFWEPIFTETAEHQIRIALEFCPTIGNFALGPFMWRPLFEATKAFPNFGLNYDPAHLIWQMIDPYAPLEEFKSHIFSVHAKDCFVDRTLLAEHGISVPYRSLKMMPHGLEEEQPLWWKPRLPGEGDLDWDRFLRSLLGQEYDGVFIVEHEDPRYLGSRERSVEGLRLGISYLKQQLQALYELKETS